MGSFLSLWYPQETKVDESLLSPVLGRILKRFSTNELQQEFMTNGESPKSRHRRTSGVSLNSATKLNNGYGSMKANSACDGGDSDITNNNPDDKSITSESVCLASTGNQPKVCEKDEVNSSSAENTPICVKKSKDTDIIIEK